MLALEKGLGLAGWYTGDISKAWLGFIDPRVLGLVVVLGGRGLCFSSEGLECRFGGGETGRQGQADGWISGEWVAHARAPSIRLSAGCNHTLACVRVCGCECVNPPGLPARRTQARAVGRIPEVGKASELASFCPSVENPTPMGSHRLSGTVVACAFCVAYCRVRM